MLVAVVPRQLSYLWCLCYQVLVFGTNGQQVASNTVTDDHDWNSWTSWPIFTKLDVNVTVLDPGRPPLLYFLMFPIQKYQYRGRRGLWDRNDAAIRYWSDVLWYLEQWNGRLLKCVSSFWCTMAVRTWEPLVLKLCIPSLVVVGVHWQVKIQNNTVKFRTYVTLRRIRVTIVAVKKQ